MAAFTIQGTENSTLSNIKDLYQFISDFKNFHSIMPEDKIEGFSSSSDSCSFSIKGITNMTIMIIEKIPNELVYFSSTGLSKFNFNLKVIFKGSPSESGTCRVEMLGDLNPFILKMAESSLTNLVNTMSLRLSQLQISSDAN